MASSREFSLLLMQLKIEVTLRDESDSTHLKDLTNQIKNFHSSMEISTPALDAGYDGHPNYQLLSELNINPIIALNQRAGTNPLLTGDGYFTGRKNFRTSRLFTRILGL